MERFSPRAGVLLSFILAGSFGLAASSLEPAPPAPAAPVPLDAAGNEIEVPPPPFTDGIFPCSGCHADRAPNRTRRVLTEFHDDIVLRHDEQHRWCLDCHDADDRDSLHLASGAKVSFEQSYLLCGQCHGEKLRDWRAGVHGRRTGNWDGHKKYLLCAHCHNPHQPHFRPLAPRPAPIPPHRPGTTAPVPISEAAKP